MRCGRYLLPAWAGLAWAVLGPGPAAGGDPPAPAESVAALVARLGSQSPRERVEATRLLGQREDAAAALRAALASPDAEVVRLARRALAEHVRRRHARAVRTAAAGELDLFALRVALLPGGADADLWAAMAKAAGRLAEEAGKLNGYRYPLPDAADLGKPLGPRSPDDGLGKERCTGRHVMPTGGRAGSTVGNCMLLSGGDFRVRSALKAGVYFAAGGCRVEGQALGCLLVCDGDVHIESSYAGRVVVVTRGSVRADEGITFGVVLAGGKVTLAEREKSFFPRRDQRVIRSVVREGQTEFLASAHFFEPASRGVTVEAAEGGVRVVTLAAGKPFAAAGFAKGDVVASVNGAKVASAEAFRVALRRGLAEGQFVEFRVRRGGQERTLSASFED